MNVERRYSHAGVKGDSERWAWTVKAWRVRLVLTVYKHASANTNIGDRWVIEPRLIYDRPKPL